MTLRQLTVPLPFPSYCVCNQTSLLLPNLFPLHFCLNFCKDLSMMLAVSTSSSPFLSLTHFETTKTAHIKTIAIFTLSSLWFLLSLLLLDLLASFHPPDYSHLSCNIFFVHLYHYFPSDFLLTHWLLILNSPQLDPPPLDLNFIF